MLKLAVALVILISIIILSTCVGLNKRNKQKYFPLVVIVGVVGMLIIFGAYIYHFY